MAEQKNQSLSFEQRRAQIVKNTFISHHPSARTNTLGKTQLRSNDHIWVIRNKIVKIKNFDMK